MLEAQIVDSSNFAGPAAVIASVGGVMVSLSTVYLNNKKQNKHAVEVEDELRAEVERLRGEVALLTKRLINAEEAKIEKDRLMEMMQAYGGRRLRKRILQYDLSRGKSE